MCIDLISSDGGCGSALRMSQRAPTFQFEEKISVAMDPACSIPEHKVASGVGLCSSASGPYLYAFHKTKGVGLSCYP